MRVLLAEDDVRLAEVLRQALEESGWDADVVHDGTDAYEHAVEEPRGAYDVIVLDWMLPGVEGIEVCRRLRRIGIPTQVMMLTARGDVRDRVTGLDAGADDYLPKPFDLDEFLARLRVMQRRSLPAEEGAITVGGLVVDPLARRVSRDGVEIDLSAREFDILHLLTSRAGRAVSRYTILDEVWDGETDVRSNVIDVHLAAIRAKIDRPFGTSTITTLRGAGDPVEPKAGH
ncbi:two-component system response regulator TcrA [soil metagenome]